MTKKENKQRIKNEALKKIRNLYNPKIKTRYSPWSEYSLNEQRDSMIEF